MSVAAVSGTEGPPALLMPETFSAMWYVQALTARECLAYRLNKDGQALTFFV